MSFGGSVAKCAPGAETKIIDLRERLLAVPKNVPLAFWLTAWCVHDRA